MNKFANAELRTASRARIGELSKRAGLDPKAAVAPADVVASARAQAKGPGMIVTEVERRLGSHYTIDVLRILKARYPGVRFVWLMGADNLNSLHGWRGWVNIMREMPVAVIARPGTELKSRFSPAARRFDFARLSSSEAPTLADRTPPAWVYLRAPLNFASSTALRARLRPAGLKSPR